MINKYTIPQKSFGRKLITGLSALVLGGCSWIAGPKTGLNYPQVRATELGSGTKYGLSVEGENEKGIRLEAEFEGFSSSEGIVSREAKQARVGVSAPVARKRRTTAFAGAELSQYKDTSKAEIMPGFVVEGELDLTGVGASIGARFQAGKGEVEVKATRTWYTDKEANLEGAVDLDLSLVYRF